MSDQEPNPPPEEEPRQSPLPLPLPFNDPEVFKRAEEKLSQHTRLNFRALFPKELAYTLVVLIVVGIAIFLGLKNNASDSATLRFDNEPLWDLHARSFIPSSRFVEKEKEDRARLLESAKKAGNDYINALIDLGDLYVQVGQWDLGADCFSNCLSTLKDLHALLPPLELNCQCNIGFCDAQMNQDKEAIEHLEQARKIKSPSISFKEIKLIWQGLALAYLQKGMLEQARSACLNQFYAIGAPLPSKTPSDIRESAAFWQCQVADIDRRLKRYKLAALQFDQAIQYLQNVEGKEGPDVARARLGLALSLSHQGMLEPAQKNYKLALNAAEASEGVKSPLARGIRQAYANTLWQTNWIAAAALNFSSDNQDQ